MGELEPSRGRRAGEESKRAAGRFRNTLPEFIGLTCDTHTYIQRKMPPKTDTSSLVFILT